MLHSSFVRLAFFVVVAGFFAAPPPALAQKDALAPKPDTYLCPNATGPKAIDCFLNAIEHLYTMCRQVKSIEIIEFGYEKSDEGVNGAKSEYCVDKHKLSMVRPYQAALKEATGHRMAVDGLRASYDEWQKSLADLKWKQGETDDAYKSRVGKPYDTFKEQAAVVLVALAEDAAKPKVTAKPAPAKPAPAKPAQAKPAQAKPAAAKPAAAPVKAKSAATPVEASPVAAKSPN